jgi:chromosome segregation ATPase
MQVAEEAESLRVAVERLRSERAKHERQLTAAQQQLDHRESLLAEQQQQLLANLARHREALDDREKRLDHRQKEFGIRTQQDITAALEEQQQVFLAAATMLDEQVKALQEEREEFEAQRDRVTENLRYERALFEDRKREVEQNVAHLRSKLAARQATVDQRRASLEQMKQQVFELHRETIEMRMVAEQLWQHNAKGKPVAELTRSIGTLRAKLADEFRVSHAELARKEQYLRELAGKLEQRQQQLTQQRAELSQWRERQNAAIEEQAARLVAREQELDAQQRAVGQREAAWREERRTLQARLRQFTRQIRPHAAAAA